MLPFIPYAFCRHASMNTLPSLSYDVSDYLDIVDSALATLSRRLPMNVSRDDLASVGKLALVATLNQPRGTVDEVRAYCFVRVRGAMLDELRRLDPLSRGHREKFTAVVRAQAELSGRLGRAASVTEIAVATKLSATDVVVAQATPPRCLVSVGKRSGRGALPLLLR